MERNCSAGRFQQARFSSCPDEVSWASIQSGLGTAFLPMEQARVQINSFAIALCSVRHCQLDWQS